MLSNDISVSETKSYKRLAVKLNDPQFASKTYWSIWEHL